MTASPRREYQPPRGMPTARKRNPSTASSTPKRRRPVSAEGAIAELLIPPPEATSKRKAVLASKVSVRPGDVDAGVSGDELTLAARGGRKRVLAEIGIQIGEPHIHSRGVGDAVAAAIGQRDRDGVCAHVSRLYFHVDGSALGGVLEGEALGDADALARCDLARGFEARQVGGREDDQDSYDSLGGDREAQA